MISDHVFHAAADKPASLGFIAAALEAEALVILSEDLSIKVAVSKGKTASEVRHPAAESPAESASKSGKVSSS